MTERRRLPAGAPRRWGLRQYLTHLRGGENTAALELTTAGTSFPEGAGSSLPKTGDVGSSTIADFTITSVRPAPGSGVFDAGDPHVVTAEIAFERPHPEPEHERAVEFTVVRVDERTGVPSRGGTTRLVEGAPLFHTVEFSAPEDLPSFVGDLVLTDRQGSDLSAAVSEARFSLPPGDYWYRPVEVGAYMTLQPDRVTDGVLSSDQPFTVGVDGVYAIPFGSTGREDIAITAARDDSVILEHTSPPRMLVDGYAVVNGERIDVHEYFALDGRSPVFTVTENEVTADWSCVDAPADEECP